MFIAQINYASFGGQVSQPKVMSDSITPCGWSRVYDLFGGGGGGCVV